jgi:hypothetical protein
MPADTQLPHRRSRSAATTSIRRALALVVLLVGLALTVGGPTASRSAAATDADTRPPSVPQGMAFSAKTRTTVSLVWNAARDDVGVSGYRLYRNGVRVATVTALRYKFTRLRCGTRYTLALEAIDAAGNASLRAEATGSITTTSCATTTRPPKPSAPRPRPSPPRPKGSGANVWIDPSGGSCRRSSALAPYANSRACGSLQAAYNAAASGDIVNIADGTYGSQGLAPGSKSLLFRAVGPGRPSFGQIVSAASNVTIRGILIQDRSSFNGPCRDPDNAVLYPCGEHQTFENVIVDGLNEGDDHGIRGVGDGFVLRNSIVRNIRDQKGFEAGADDMRIENNLWRNIRVTNSDVHNECMYVNGGNRSVYRGNRFIGCPTMALFFTNWAGGPAYRDVVVENNVFGHTLDDDQDWHASCAFKIGSGANNQNTLVGWQVRYNTFETGTCVDDLPGSSSTWIGNLGGISCVRAFSYRHNVGQTCGGVGDVRVSNAVNGKSSPNAAPFYVNAPSGDFRLRRGAVAINRGDPKVYPRIDAARRVRPIGPAPDAGAYEFRP